MPNPAKKQASHPDPNILTFTPPKNVCSNSIKSVILNLHRYCRQKQVTSFCSCSIRLLTDLSVALTLSLSFSFSPHSLSQRERMNPYSLTHTFTYTLAHPNHSLQAYVHLLACQFIPALNKTTIQVHKNLFHSFVTSFAISWTTLSSFTPLSDHCHQIIKSYFLTCSMLMY